MSTLAVKQLSNNNPISMKIRLDKSETITAFRYHLYKKASPDGNIIINFKQNSNIIGTGGLSSEDIGNIPGTYFHGMVKFNLDNDFKVHFDEDLGYAELEIEVYIENHTDDDNNYIGLVKESDVYSEYADDLTYLDENQRIWYYSFDFELYGWQNP